MATPTAQDNPRAEDSPPVADGPVVVFKNVTIKFDVKPVLEDISFTVQPGETRIILGPAGCGKSVLMKLANGLICPDNGSIHVFGQDVTKMREVDLYKLRSRIGMVFQESALFDSLSVEDNVAYRLHEEKVPEDESHARVVESLKFVELEKDPETLNSLAWAIIDPEAKLEKRDYASALLLAEAAAKASKMEDGMILDTYALALFKTGDKKKAIELQTKAVEIYRKDKEVDPKTLKEMEDRLAEFKKAPNV